MSNHFEFRYNRNFIIFVAIDTTGFCFINVLNVVLFGQSVIELMLTWKYLFSF